jgi:hypothetical protein
MATRDITTPETRNSLCVSGWSNIESAQHLFLSCSTFWFSLAVSSVMDWFFVDGLSKFIKSFNFLPFTYAAGGIRARSSFLQLIWLLFV